MAIEDTNTGAVLNPVEQRTVVLTPDGDDEILAARTEASEIYLPIRPICAALGVSWTTQYRKVRADDVLMESVRTLRLQTRGGPQNLVCMDIESIPMWLAGIEPSRVRADLRDRLKSYKRWVRKVVYEAFARETGLESARGTGRTPTESNSDAQALEHIAQMAEAIAVMARQQLAFEQHVDTRFSTLDTQMTVLVEGQDTLTGRLDQAAAVVGSLLKRVGSIEGLVAPGQVINETQAAEISALVKAIATELAAVDKETGQKGRNPYQAVFGELYRRFRVSSYHNIPASKLCWLLSPSERTPAAERRYAGPVPRCRLGSIRARVGCFSHD